MLATYPNTLLAYRDSTTKHMLKLMDQKIFTSLLLKVFLYCPMVANFLLNSILLGSKSWPVVQFMFFLGNRPMVAHFLP